MSTDKHQIANPPPRPSSSTVVHSRPLHSWRLSPKRAVALQEQLRDRIADCPLRPWPEFVAGADISYAKRADELIAAVVVLRLPGLVTVAETWVIRRTRYPYVPGLLTFREAPAMLAAFKQLRSRWDAAIFDGQGRAHPRGMGLAAHIGLWLDAPTIGCAKSRLIGEATEPGPAPGDRAPLMFDGGVVGAVLRTRGNVKPVFVSAGHKSNLADSIRLVMACCAGYRVPEPIRRAHALVTRLRSARA
jgi:deoxyribonuclease V